ncbi:MAG: hypothetical protein ACFFAU_15820 [Candidatus Hodarchaeota archaeon]
MDIYSLLNHEGILVIGEPKISGIFAPEQARYFEIIHKWMEASWGSHFYDEDSFRIFVSINLFEEAELIYSDKGYIWVFQDMMNNHFLSERFFHKFCQIYNS